MRKLLILLITLLITSQVFAQERQIFQDETAQAAWAEDIDYLLEKLQARHPNPHFRFSAAEFEQVAAELKAELPYLTDDQIQMELARITAMLDGHTYLWLFQDRIGFHQYPITLYEFAEGFYVVDADIDYAHLIGTRLLTVNGTDVQALYDRLAPYSSTDNEYHLKLWVTQFMVSPEMLQAIGVIENADTPNMVFEDNVGELVTVNFSTLIGHNMAMIGLPEQPAPLYLSNRAENFWYSYLEAVQTLYIQYNHVYSTTASGLSIRALASSIESIAAENEVERLVIDIRHNGGGDNTTYHSLINAIVASEFSEPGRLFVIIGRLTFSAAKDFALDLAKQVDVIFVGEPSGGSPLNYGDNAGFRLPNSGIQFFVATTTINKARPQDTELWIAPDILVPETAADYFAGRDAALEAILNYGS